MTHPPPEATVERVDGVNVRITRATGKPLMVLTRMASGGMGIWDPVWSALANDYTVANLELADAAGLDRDAPPRVRFEHLADRTAAVARALGHERFHVFGWFGGTHVALACMLRHPASVASAILLDPFFEMADPRKLEHAIAFKRALMAAPDPRTYLYYWVMAGFSPAFLESRFDEVDRLVGARATHDRFVALEIDARLRWARALRSRWLDDTEYAAMRTPTLIMASELDGWHAGPTVGMAREVVQRMPAAELAIVAGLGTFCFLEAPERFDAIAGGFLRRHAAA